MTGVLSKFVYDQGERLGIPRLALARGIYTAAILGYVAKVVVFPAIAKRSKRRRKDRNEGGGQNKNGEDEEAKKEAIMRSISKRKEDEEERKKRKKRGPAVNREFFERLRFLLR